MRLRSLLFVPGDRPERFARAAASGADVIILDLEDSVVPAHKAMAATAVADYLAQPATVRRCVRVNPLDSARIAADLAVAGAADLVMLPKAEGADCIRRLRALLPDCPPILPIATETPAALFALGSYAQVGAHLAGLCWGSEDLPAAIGAETSRNPDGSYTRPYEMVRALALFAAHAAGVAAIDSIHPALDDLDGLARFAARGARDGFTGMLALHPKQVPVINAAYTPSAETIAHAQAIIAAFAAHPEAGALRVNGQMVDRPHLLQAQKILARS